MSNIRNLIFKDNPVIVTSKRGWRIHPITKKWNNHLGVDYGTNIRPDKQYCIGEGKVLLAKSKSDGSGLGNRVYVEYPQYGIIIQYAHLATINVKTKDSVNANDFVGTTGKTGAATGVHAHIGMFPIEDWNKSYYSKRWGNVEKFVLKNINIHVVKKGEYLSKIARKYNMSWQRLYAMNKEVIGDNPNKIKIGTELKIK